MKIAMITGSFPPAVCGVGYYTHCLVDSIRAAGNAVEVIAPEQWHLSDARSILRTIDGLIPDVIHIQYPTIGYGASLLPQLISLARPCVVTLHELSQAHILRKLSLFPFTLRSRHVIFTTSFEQTYAARCIPWIRKHSSVIPIGSNITVRRKSSFPVCSDIIHFGIIRPNKGLEDVIRLAELIKHSSLHLGIRIVGKTHPDHMAYAAALKQQTEELPVSWHLDLSDAQVEQLFSEACIAYQPYPDGASERRSSILALLQADIAMITTRGRQFPDDLAAAVEIADDPHHALESIQKLLVNREQLLSLAQKGKRYTSKFTWETIAKRHLDVYHRVAGRAER